VSGIKKTQLDELRAFLNPSATIKVALEPVICLITKNPVKTDWKEIREQLRKPDFIKNIMNFEKNDITPKVK
jgi:hypothetical protein